MDLAPPPNRRLHGAFGCGGTCSAQPLKLRLALSKPRDSYKKGYQEVVFPPMPGRYDEQLLGSHNIVEGRRLVEAARKYDRIVQHGTQRRSDPKWSTLTADVRRGKYGQLRLARIQIHRPRESIGVRSAERPPVELDYNLWNGPAPVHPYRTNLVHYDWHWIWDFGNGEIGSLGTHQLDLARWAMPAGAAPQSVVSVGGRFGYQDQGQTPNTQLTLVDCGDVKLLCEQRGLVGRKATKVTVEFQTSEGVVKEGKFFPKGRKDGEPIVGAPVGGFADLGL